MRRFLRTGLSPYASGGGGEVVEPTSTTIQPRLLEPALAMKDTKRNQTVTARTCCRRLLGGTHALNVGQRTLQSTSGIIGYHLQLRISGQIRHQVWVQNLDDAA